MDEPDLKFRAIAKNLSPETPIRSSEFLRGRDEDLNNVVRELTYFQPVVFVYGPRGVGKTSFARTSAQLVNSSAIEHVYVACAPGARMLQVFREIGEELLVRIFRSGAIEDIKKSVEVEISLTPAVRTSFEKQEPVLPKFEDSNSALRVLRDLDGLMPAKTVIVLDELEELDESDRTDLAYLIKQVGDQEFQSKFVLVGIASNVHELIGTHESLPRYLKEVPLSPLSPEDLMEIVAKAAAEIEVEVPRDVLLRIAVVGNGFPHFAHLMGKAILIEAVLNDSSTVQSKIYRSGINRAVQDSLQELRISYEAATQRGQDYFKHMIWALAHSDIVDLRIDDWISLYMELCSEHSWPKATEKALRTAISNFSKENHGQIISNTPARYGATEMRYRYKRFTSTLMRGHVRLQAENEGTRLGRIEVL
ncbi:MAG: ATP-binding protein [Pseudomonadales bacterium]